MRRPKHLFILLCVLCASAVNLSPTLADAKPNIVLIVADDLGYGELSCQSPPNYDLTTPRIDSIARNGVRFTSGYVTAPVCSPSRAGFLTGRYQQRFGHELNAVEAQSDDPRIGLPLSQHTMADYLHAAGYATGIMGKWHLGAHPPFHPFKRGFDEFYGFLREGHYYFPQHADSADVVTHFREREPEYDRLNPILRGTQEIAEPQYLTRAITREAVSFIRRHKGKPFFLYVPYNAVHSPMMAPKSGAYSEQYKDIKDDHRRVFAAMLAALDGGVGEILDELRRENLEQNTLLIFLSDNGGPTRELTSSNLPLRGGKGQLLEGGIRIPFMMQWPGRVPAGRVDDRPVISLDILPTALAAASVMPPADAKLDGVNLLPFLSDTPGRPPHDALFWRYGRSSAIRSGNYKLLHEASRAVGGKGKKGKSDEQPTSGAQLYDLSKDVSESTNLAQERPDVVKQLDAELQRWNSQLIEPLWGPAGVR
jgi:arylsulfatase A-like enzyme